MNVHAKIEGEEVSGALIALPPSETAIDAFKTKAAIDPYLKMVRGHIDAFKHDLSTSKGRKEIASIAAKVSKSKTALDDVGKALVADLKDLPKQIDATRKYMRDTLDEWRDEVRKPLTDWEAAETARVAKHESALARMEQLATGMVDGRQMTSDEIRRAIDEIAEPTSGEDTGDFFDAYVRTKARASSALLNLLDAREKSEREAAELEHLRREKAEREAKDKQEADARAAEERESRIRKEAEEAADKRAADAAERQRRDGEEREAQLRRDAEAADRRAAEAEERARAELAAQQKRDADDAAARERNTKHRATVNGAALAALVAGGLSEDAAKQAITLIAKGMIPRVSISY